MTLGNMHLRFVSVQVPRSINTDGEYESILMAVEEVMMDGRRKRRMNVIGIDANAVLGEGAPSDREDIIGEYGFGQRYERRENFA